jgi:hypothetical protein
MRDDTLWAYNTIQTHCSRRSIGEFDQKGAPSRENLTTLFVMFGTLLKYFLESNMV